MSKTSIEWCDHSINPIRARDLRTGAVGHYCEKISRGCANCYASSLQWRFSMPPFNEQRHAHLLGVIEPFLDESRLEEVLRRRTPTRYFWADMSDLLGRWVQQEWIERCFETMALTPQHTHLVLTKRPERLREWRIACEPFPHIWLGTSVENQAAAEERIPLLLETRAAVRFLSVEPLLEAVDLRRWLSLASDVQWIIVGSESGPRARPMEVEWARSVVDQCRAARVAVFVKQIGTPEGRAHGNPKGTDPRWWPAGDWPRGWPGERGASTFQSPGLDETQTREGSSDAEARGNRNRDRLQRRRRIRGSGHDAPTDAAGL